MFNYRKFSAVEEDDDFMKESPKTPKSGSQRKLSNIFGSATTMKEVEEDHEFLKQLDVFPNKEEKDPKEISKQIDAFTVLNNIGKTIQNGAKEKEKPRVISHNFMQNINSLIIKEEKKENTEKKEKRLEVLHHISGYFSGPDYLLNMDENNGGDVNWTPDLILQDNPELDSAIDSILDKLSSCESTSMLSSSSEIMNHLSLYLKHGSGNNFPLDFDGTMLESPTFDEMELDSEEYKHDLRNKIPPFL
jgi:DNA repair ATPase RecN